MLVAAVVDDHFLTDHSPIPNVCKKNFLHTGMSTPLTRKLHFNMQLFLRRFGFPFGMRLVTIDPI